MHIGRSVISGIALIIVLWLIWSRLFIMIHVNVPWWGFLIGAVLLFLAIDYMLGKIFSRRS